MNMLLKNAIWILIAVLGASAVGGIALNRGENISALWFITAALCVYAIAYRFYAAWIAATVLVVDDTRATPAERLDNGRDFVPTNKWIVFGHHFAAIAGPGPLVGTNAGRAVWVSARYAVDLVWRGAGRLCSGYDDIVSIYPA